MGKVRCKDCQYFNFTTKYCYRYENLNKRDMYDECIEYEQSENYHRCNYRNGIESIINDISDMIDEGKCFMDAKENYKLEILTKILMDLVESHGIHSWKYED